MHKATTTDLIRDKSFDSTLSLIRKPYKHIGDRCRKLSTDVFATRLGLRQVICMKGEEAARIFYDDAKFIRNGAMLGHIKKSLFGEGGVQDLDGEAHRHRKGMFMSLMGRESVARLAEINLRHWREHAMQWKKPGKVELCDEACDILTLSVCEWTGVPLEKAEIKKRSGELKAMFLYAGAIGPKHWWSRIARKSAEKWIAGIVRNIRDGKIKPPQESAAWKIATWRELDGKLLDPSVAAVELLNILRPTAAIAVDVVFIAHALHENPGCREAIAASDEECGMFVEEVRRFYPFFPSVMAIVREDFEWKGYRFPKNTRAILDLYGTNHDEKSWKDPGTFNPRRFVNRDENLYDFVPQGGATQERHHRCAGEQITVELMKVAARFLAGELRYEVPEQDLRLDLSRLPGLPRSFFIKTSGLA